MASPRLPCVTCGRLRYYRNGGGRINECSGCRRLANTRPRPEDALTGGQWVRRGLIHVWVPNESDVA